MAIDAILAILMLTGASISDLQTRRVPNRFWMPWIVVAAVLWVERFRTGEWDGILLAGAAVMTALLYAMWYIGSFGGADAKGLMVLAWLWPGAPDLLMAQTVPALDLLVNAALVALLMPIAFVATNLARGHVAMPAMLLGTKTPIAQAEARHVWPMQVVEGERLRWRFWHRPTDDLRTTYSRLRAAGVETVWTTPKIPFMVPLTLGAVVAAWLGNIVLWAMLR